MGIFKRDNGDINVSNVDMSSKSDEPTSSPVAKPSTSGSAGSAQNGIVCRNGHVTISGQVVMGSNNSNG